MDTAEIRKYLEEALDCEYVDPVVRGRLIAGRSVLLRRETRELQNRGQNLETKRSGYSVSASAPVSPTASSYHRRTLQPRTSSQAPLEIVWRHPCKGKVSVYGTFTEPPWVEIKMLRDVKEGHFKVDLSDWGLSPGTYIFKFVVDGEWRIDPTLTTRQDLNGQVNNTMFIRSSVRPLKTVRSAPSVETIDESTSTVFIRGSPPLFQEANTAFTHRLDDTGPSDRSTSKLALICGGWMIPHPDKIASGGADSFFFSTHAAGVADGVGEWEWRFKLDPRKFAEQLMKGCLIASERNRSSEDKSAEEIARTVLSEGYEFARAFGSSTACVAALDERGERLGIANLGDSGMVHFRKQFLTGALSMTCVMRTKEQQHGFNTPYQLSRLPDPKDYDEIAMDPIYTELITALRSLTGRQLSGIDKPEDCEEYSTRVKEGDLILFGTDGILDNLWNYDLLSVVGEAAAVSPYDARTFNRVAEVTDPEDIARAVAMAAHEKSLMTSGYKSPFGVECRKRTGQVHLGGKTDDITAVICWVCREEDVTWILEKLEKNKDGKSTCRDWWRIQRGKTRNSSSDDVRRHSRFEQFI